MLWHCFRASCHKKGIYRGELSTRDVRRLLDEKTYCNSEKFVLPLCTSVMNSERAVNYLRRNNCLWAYTEKLADIRYDPKLDRVVFIINRDGVPVDAVGRSLEKTNKPKWLRYGKSSELFTTGTSRIGVIVEDAASACAVATVATGIALLGTSLPTVSLLAMKNMELERIIIALDQDATRRSIQLHRRISFYVPCSVAMLKDDLKYLSPDEIKKVLNLG